MNRLLTPIKYLPYGITLRGENYYRVLSMVERFADRLQMETPIVRISDSLNNNGLALPLSNMIVLGEKYSPDGPEDVVEVSVGFIAGHEVGHIYDYRGIERGLIHRTFLLFPFILYEYLRNQFGGWIGNILYRAIMWIVSFLLFVFVNRYLFPALVELGVPAAAPSIQVLVLTTILWNNYFLGIKLRSEVYANYVAKKLLWECFSIDQGKLVMFEEAFYIVELLTLNAILVTAFLVPAVAVFLLNLFGSVFGFLSFLAAVNMLVAGMIFKGRGKKQINTY